MPPLQLPSHELVLLLAGYTNTRVSRLHLLVKRPFPTRTILPQRQTVSHAPPEPTTFSHNRRRCRCALLLPSS
jgi:hypothetical protein